MASPSAGTWACCWPDPAIPPPPPPPCPFAWAAQRRLAACRGEGQSPILRHHTELSLESSACKSPSVLVERKVLLPSVCASRADPVAPSEGKPRGILIKPGGGVGVGISVFTLIGGANAQGVAGRGAARKRKRKRKATFHLEEGGSSSICNRAASRSGSLEIHTLLENVGDAIATDAARSCNFSCLEVGFFSVLPEMSLLMKIRRGVLGSWAPGA